MSDFTNHFFNPNNLRFENNQDDNEAVKFIATIGKAFKFYQLFTRFH